MIRTGTGEKTGRRMGHMPIDGDGRLARGAARTFGAPHLRAHQQHQSDPGRRLARAPPRRGRRLGGRVGRHGDRAVKLMTPDELEAALRDIGARRYHRLHPFHKLLHGGKCTKGQVQAWALNRYYYQAMIPIKDASLIARCDDSAIRREWRSPPGRSRRRARRRRRHRALAQADRRARPRPRLRHLAARAAAGDALRGRGLCALRAREDAARGDRLVAHRIVLAADHRRAGRGDAGELSVRHARDARLFRQAAAAGRSAIPISRSTTARRTRARPSSSSRCWRRSNSNAACCGRCATRCTTPMSIPKQIPPGAFVPGGDELGNPKREPLLRRSVDGQSRYRR